MSQKTFQTKKLVATALFTALTMIATLLVQIPLPLGYIHLGDGLVFLSVFILGPVWGTVAAGVGSALADVFAYATYAPATLIIKAAMAFLAWLVQQALYKTTKRRMFAEIAAGIVGALVMAFGYFLFETLLISTAGVAIVNVPWNLLQGGIGVAVSVAIMRLLIATKVLNSKLFSDNDK